MRPHGLAFTPDGMQWLQDNTMGAFALWERATRS